MTSDESWIVVVGQHLIDDRAMDRFDLQLSQVDEKTSKEPLICVRLLIEDADAFVLFLLIEGQIVIVDRKEVVRNSIVLKKSESIKTVADQKRADVPSLVLVAGTWRDPGNSKEGSDRDVDAMCEVPLLHCEVISKDLIGVLIRDVPTRSSSDLVERGSVWSMPDVSNHLFDRKKTVDQKGDVSSTRTGATGREFFKSFSNQDDTRVKALQHDRILTQDVIMVSRPPNKDVSCP